MAKTDKPPAKRGRGRPRLHDEEQVVHVRMEKACWRKFRQQARKLGISTNAFVVQAAVAGAGSVQPAPPPA